jgi:uncharacterized membrane protein YidH (DUF202 family)
MEYEMYELETIRTRYGQATAARTHALETRLRRSKSCLKPFWTFWQDLLDRLDPSVEVDRAEVDVRDPLGMDISFIFLFALSFSSVPSYHHSCSLSLSRTRLFHCNPTNTLPALERTFLAYLRTSQAFALLGIFVAQLFRLQHAPNPDPVLGYYVVGKPLACICHGAAIFTLLFGACHWYRQQAAMLRGKVHSGSFEIKAVGGVVTLVCEAWQESQGERHANTCIDLIDVFRNPYCD